jgi:hypothetical protein
MTVTVAQADDKASDNNTVVVVQAVPNTDVRPRSRKCKYIIIGVTCSVIAALITVTVLVAIKLVNDANLQKLRIEHSFQADDTSVDESYYQDDSSSWIHEYHLTDGVVDNYVIDDVTKGVRVIKLRVSTGAFQCYVLQYKPTANTSVDPQLANGGDMSAVNKTSVTYKVSQLPINGVLSFTSPTATSFCDSLPVFLVYPKYTSQPTADFTDERVKRATYNYCYIDWMDCQYFSYADHPEFRYYGCNTKCVSFNQP